MSIVIERGWRWTDAVCVLRLGYLYLVYDAKAYRLSFSHLRSGFSGTRTWHDACNKTKRNA